MADPTPKLYEGMFLMSQSAVSAGVDSAISTVQGMLDRANAETVTLSRWDERKLAYPIENQKRGTYLHSLFRVAPVQIANIERDCNLSEDVLRVLMTRADYMGETEIEAVKNGAQTAADMQNLQDTGDEADQNDDADDVEVEEEETADAAS